MPTLAEKFDLALQAHINEATQCVDLRWSLALQIAKDLPESLAPTIFDALAVAKSLVDASARGLDAKALMERQVEVIDHALSITKSMARSKEEEKLEGQYLHRSMERKG